ncbi:LamG domain-containing protein [Lentzea sp. PSKA42]|uniref:LamG domain-containing protein n=1 Tax=Lentzea indica TaxID=2604800 RepID=A0ABX1FNT6_9PSEU|nr:LamG domain-containing protein [Lentzea indica]NKE60447.1 LamG domain-containing protein [Lentzea indica]
MKKRLLAVSSIVVFALAVDGAAFAYWTAPPSGGSSGSAESGNSIALALSSATPTAALYPGGQTNVSLNASNSNAFAVSIKSLVLDMSQGTGGFAVDAGHSGCATSALNFTTQTNSSGWIVPANSFLLITLSNALEMGAGAANACQGASITTYLMANSATAYSDTVSSTGGLLNHYRLNEAALSSDTFSGTAGTALESHVGEMGATWTTTLPLWGADTGAVLTDAGRLRKADSSYASVYYSSATPASADYRVSADIRVMTSVAYDQVGVIGRFDTANTLGTYYIARYSQTAAAFFLFRVVNGEWVSLGQYGQALVDGSTYRLSLDLSGTTIRLLVDGVERVSAVDSAISGTGRVGTVLGMGWNGAPVHTDITNTTGMHLDNFQASNTPVVVDSKGSNTGEYFGGVLLGHNGAVAQAGTAVLFDGVDDYASISRQIADDFSIEFWFKSTQGRNTQPDWWSGAGMVDAEVAGSLNDFGVSLRSDGKVVAGTGNPDVSVVSTGTGYNNTAWHHVVFTRTKATGALKLYVDGVSAGTATGNTNSLTTPTSINFGRMANGSNHFEGSLDEVALYNSVLSAATVTAHFSAGGS